MSLNHRSQLTHYFSPTRSHLKAFFRNLGDLYREQHFTDLIIVAGNGRSGAKRRESQEDDEEEQQDDNDNEDEVEVNAAFATHQVGNKGLKRYWLNFILGQN